MEPGTLAYSISEYSENAEAPGATAGDGENSMKSDLSDYGSDSTSHSVRTRTKGEKKEFI